MHSVFINGEPATSIAVTDRGLQYGDGVFETIAIRDGKPQHWERHLQRLLEGCRRLSLPLPDETTLEQETYHLATGHSRAVIKIIITRGQGGRGYYMPDNVAHTRIVALYPFPDYPQENWREGVTVQLCRTPMGLNPVLAGIKHCNRLEQILARQEWQDPTIAEGLMLDINQNVIEGTMSNLFLVKNGDLITPVLDRCGVEGVMRSVILAHVRDQKIPLSVDNITVEEIREADEVFLTNSVIGIWPVRRFEGQTYPKGKLTTYLMEQILPPIEN